MRKWILAFVLLLVCISIGWGEAGEPRKGDNSVATQIQGLQRSDQILRRDIEGLRKEIWSLRNELQRIRNRD